MRRELGMRTTVILMSILCLISFPTHRKVTVRGSTQLLQDFFPPPSVSKEKKISTAPFSSLSCIPNTELQSLGCAHSKGGSKKPKQHAFPYGSVALTDYTKKFLSLADFIYLIYISEIFLQHRRLLGFCAMLAVK